MELRKPLPREYGEIGKVMLHADPSIYPALLINPLAASLIMPSLMKLPNSPFAPENFVLAAEGEEVIAGLVNIATHPFVEKTVSFQEFDRICPAVLLASCEDAYTGYFTKLPGEFGKEQAYIVALSIAPEFIGRGVKAILIQYAVKRAAEAECREIILDVPAEDAPSIHLYESLGFAIVCEKKGYAYQDDPPRMLRMAAQL